VGGYACLYRLGQTWGATDQELQQVLAGDELLPDARARTTHAITIAAHAREVWPWLVQMGWGRAGWYTYRWVDRLLFPANGPSADRILPQLQQLQVGEQILMLPGMGPRVRDLQPNRYLLAGDREGGTWCLALYPTLSGCRLVSRWRQRWPLTPATAFWILVSDPGAFIMERKMLKGIRARAERSAQLADAGPGI
jgi:hypothetical protein